MWRPQARTDSFAPPNAFAGELAVGMILPYTISGLSSSPTINLLL
jgi:hypothetical protein